MTKPRAPRITPGKSPPTSAGSGGPLPAASVRPESATAPVRPEPAAAGLTILDADNNQPLPPGLAELIQAARAAQAQAYAPYSGFSVGAAVRTSDGRIFIGANVENASYGLAVCAERTAVLSAVLAGARQLVGVAVCTSLWPPAAPCGMCRQTLAEFAHDAEVVLCSPSGPAQRTRLAVLLPHAFRPSDLAQFAEQSQPAPRGKKRV